MSRERKSSFIEQREKTRNEERHRKDREDYLAALNSAKQAYIDAHKDDGRKEGWKGFREYLTIALLFVTILLTGLTYKVFYDTMVDARLNARDVHNVSVNTENMTADALGQSQSMANVAHADNAAALGAARIQNRAEIAITLADFNNGEGKLPPSVMVVGTNTGETPAYAMRGEAHIAFEPYPLPVKIESLPVEKPVGQNTATIAKGKFSSIYAVGRAPLTADELAAFKDGSKFRIYVWGDYQFTDSFDVRQRAHHFCLVFDADEYAKGRAPYCPRYND